MATHKLSKRTLQTFTPRSTAYIAYDRELAGFGCRISPSGTKSWIVEYRPNGGGRRVSKRRLTLGSIQNLSADQARRAARDVLAQARLGQDPASERSARREAATVAELVEQYMREEVAATCKPRTRDLYRRHFKLHVLPDLGCKKACDIGRPDVASLHRKIGASHPVTANRVLMLISGLFRWASLMDLVPAGMKPTVGIGKFKEQGRERYLTNEELARLGDALREAEEVGLPWQIDESRPTAKHAPKPENRRQKISPLITAAIRLLLLTGCRLREVLHLQWREIDFQRRMLFLADSKTGRKTVVLSEPAIELLRALPRLGPYVFPGTRLDQPRHDLQRPWAAIAKHAELDGVRLHDLRHSFAATGAGSGLGLPVIGKLLGHRDWETTSRYAHVAIDPLTLAANAIAAKIAEAMSSGLVAEEGLVETEDEAAQNAVQLIANSSTSYRVPSG